MSPFERFTEEIKQGVQAYAKANGRHAGIGFWLKLIVLLALWVFLYYYIIFIGGAGWGTYLMTIAWGVCSLLIVFNIGHDAVHGTISRHSWVNQLLSYCFNFVGGNAYSWKLKHNMAHHLHTNIEGRDFDTDLAPLMRLSPKTPYASTYKWQYLTFLFVYSSLSLLMIIVGDFKIFNQVGAGPGKNQQPIIQWVILIFSKICYFSLVFLVPLTFGAFTPGNVLFGFVSFHLVNGWIIAFVFMPSHYFPESVYHSQKPADYNWYEHQMASTMDLSPENWPLSFILGALNHNVAHHVFPNFCHTHYFELSKIIRRSARSHGVPYNSRSYRDGFRAHLRLLKQLSYRDAS